MAETTSFWSQDCSETDNVVACEDKKEAKMATETIGKSLLCGHATSILTTNSTGIRSSVAALYLGIKISAVL